jgi:hypothetical protein
VYRKSSLFLAQDSLSPREWRYFNRGREK